MAPYREDPWEPLRALTSARIALGSAGGSLPTNRLLEFQMAHARARDAVHRPLDAGLILEALSALGLEVVKVHSAASDRTAYLQRPDLGRRLDEDSGARLEWSGEPPEVVFVVADGLSALAVERHAAATLERVLPRLVAAGWRIGPAVLVEQGRVAIGDEIGERTGARIVAVLIGERPGLSSPDSLGIYLTYDPRIGRTDAERNCISNVRPDGLSYELAAHKLTWLMEAARHRRLTGVGLREEAPGLAASAEPARIGRSSRDP